MSYPNCLLKSVDKGELVEDRDVNTKGGQDVKKSMNNCIEVHDTHPDWEELVRLSFNNKAVVRNSGQLLRLKMFREDHGSWMTMFFSTILFLFIFSHIYNLFLIMAGNMSAYIITDFMGIRNENFMKVAAVGTWMGDFVTAWMVTDMMLQDKPYPDWGKSARAFWKKGNIRIILFWTVLFTLTSVVVLVITTDWISWDKLNRGFLPSDEVSRAFLASFILVFDLLIVMQ
ncbi:PREDICTED: transmembrane protein 117-like, partial [Eurypyga helias]|uniref:transmembrane protein 117-like n=1 Tax=Eurypyga helias TaxID=54383 RepID=UPI000528179D